MKRHSISIKFSSGAYEGKYLTIKPRLTHWAIWSTNSHDLCTGALSRKTDVRLPSCWLNCSKHSTITGRDRTAVRAMSYDVHVSAGPPTIRYGRISRVAF